MAPLIARRKNTPLRVQTPNTPDTAAPCCSNQHCHNNNMRQKLSPTQKAAAQKLIRSCQGPTPILFVGLMVLWWSTFSVIQGHVSVASVDLPQQTEQERLVLPFMKHKEWIEQDLKEDEARRAANGMNGDTEENMLEAYAYWSLPMGLEAVLERASENKEECVDMMEEQQQTQTVKNDNNAAAMFDQRFEIPFGNTNETVATLPSFGIIEQLESFRFDPESAIAAIHKSHENKSNKNNIQQQPLRPQDWQCEIPPENECDEQKLTVIFMAHNPDRLNKMSRQVQTMLTASDWKRLVAEVVLVWNGDRAVDESPEGRQLLQFAKNQNDDASLRVVYPLQMGFDNDLMNRYHPQIVKVEKTRAILYYDDDGPFYSFAAVSAGFELWKRHSDAQIGAMAREITYGKRQREEHDQLLAGQAADDRQFVSHCTNLGDRVDYNYRYFANYDANMVLPSGSMLHVNYLCFLWHPALEPIRQFVQKHPVHPDDVTVSTVVSQLAGRAPRVYSRRLNPDDGGGDKKKKKQQQQQLRGASNKSRRRRLSEANSSEAVMTTTAIDWEVDDDEINDIEDVEQGWIPASESERHRRLMFGINWDAKGGMDQNKQYWADLRTEAINTLVQYFGSINSGSIGWCEDLPQYYNAKKDGRCDPVMARIGWLPWMNPDGSAKETCP